MAPTYTFHYFGVPSRGEFIRYIFKHKNVDFEEVNYTFDDLPKIKANEALFPLGELPTLLVANQEPIFQSHAIVRYLANEFNLYGKNNEERAVIDQVLDTLKECEQKLWGSLFFAKGDDKVEKQKAVFEKLLPRALRYVEKCLKRNNNGEAFLVGDAITVGDIHVAVLIETIKLPHNKNYRKVLDNFPLIKKLNEKVRNSAAIKTYLEKRGDPKYPFPE